MSFFSSLGMFIGRILISAYFIWSGISKFINREESLKVFQAIGIPEADTWFLVFSIIEIVGGLAILLGFFARFGALLLIIILAPATYFFHDFWHSEGEAMQVQKLFFLENLSIIGGLLYVLSAGPGAWSCCSNKKCKVKDNEKSAE